MPPLPKDATSTALQLPFWPIPRLHDEPDPEPDPTPDPGPDPKPAGPDPAPEPDPDPDPEPDPDPPLGPKGEKALAAAKAAQRKAEADARKARQDAAAALAKVQEFEDAQKSELERAQAVADRALAREAAADRRAVTAEIKALAIGKFEDPSDGIDALAGDPKRFLGADGDVDTDAVQAALDDVLARKPHWRKRDPEPVPPTPPVVPEQRRPTPPPKPDPSQGPRGGTPAPDFNDPAQLAAEAAKHGLRVKRNPRPPAR